MDHVPVLLDEVLNTLGNIPGKTIVDCTFGAGGYSRAFLEHGANVIAFDRDPSVALRVAEIAREFPGLFQFINAPFSDIGELSGKYDAIVFDLGISSMQIDIAERGFSFREDATLDMRMSLNGPTAAELIANSSVDELMQILREYGDIKNAKGLAQKIIDHRPQTTFELKKLIGNPRDIAPVFQALRIAVNDELGEIKRALSAVPDLLAPGGICVCVTFHSAEDRIVKNTFREWTTVPGDPRLPVMGAASFKLLKAIKPSAAEIAANLRARSAHLRAVEKI